jgi:hypothetical protein
VKCIQCNYEPPVAIGNKIWRLSQQLSCALVYENHVLATINTFIVKSSPSSLSAANGRTDHPIIKCQWSTHGTPLVALVLSQHWDIPSILTVMRAMVDKLGTQSKPNIWYSFIACLGRRYEELLSSVRQRSMNELHPLLVFLCSFGVPANLPSIGTGGISTSAILGQCFHCHGTLDIRLKISKLPTQLLGADPYENFGCVSHTNNWRQELSVNARITVTDTGMDVCMCSFCVE